MNVKNNNQIRAVVTNENMWQDLVATNKIGATNSTRSSVYEWFPPHTVDIRGIRQNIVLNKHQGLTAKHYLNSH